MLLRDFVNKKIASADKEASAEGVPLTLENCKKYKKMRDLKVYGNCFQDGTPTPENPIEVQCVGELVTDENDVNYGKYRVPIICRGKNFYDDKSVGYRIAECQSYEKLDNGFRAWGKNGGVDYSDYRNGQVKASKLIKLTAGQYTFSFDYYVHQPTPISTVEFRAGLLNKSENYWDEWMPIVYPSNRVGAHGRVTKTITFSEDIEFFFAWRVNGFDISIINIQIEKSDSLTDFEPYVEPITTNIYLDEPLRKTDWIDFKNKKSVHYIDGAIAEEIISVELPKITAKTTIIEVDTSLAPSNISGKYIIR